MKAVRLAGCCAALTLVTLQAQAQTVIRMLPGVGAQMHPPAAGTGAVVRIGPTPASPLLKHVDAQGSQPEQLCCRTSEVSRQRGQRCESDRGVALEATSRQVLDGHGPPLSRTPTGFRYSGLSFTITDGRVSAICVHPR